VDIERNEIVDFLSKATKHFYHKRYQNEIPFTDFIPYMHSTIFNAWKDKWSSHTTTAKLYKTIIIEIPRLPRFLNSSLPRKYIITFTRLGLGHNYLPAYSLYLDFNSSLFFSSSCITPYWRFFSFYFPLSQSFLC